MDCWDSGSSLDVRGSSILQLSSFSGVTGGDACRFFGTSDSGFDCDDADQCDLALALWQDAARSSHFLQDRAYEPNLLLHLLLMVQHGWVPLEHWWVLCGQHFLDQPLGLLHHQTKIPMAVRGLYQITGIR